MISFESIKNWFIGRSDFECFKKDYIAEIELSSPQSQVGLSFDYLASPEQKCSKISSEVFKATARDALLSGDFQKPIRKPVVFTWDAEEIIACLNNRPGKSVIIKTTTKGNSRIRMLPS